MTTLGPKRSIAVPMKGESRAEAKKPTEKAAAVVPRLQPYSSRIGGNRSEKEVRTLTLTPRVTKATATTTQP